MSDNYRLFAVASRLKWLLLVQFTTSLRVVLAILFVATAAHPQYQIAAFVLYLSGLLTDAMDGLLARHFAVSSSAGAAYDGFADKAMTVVSVLYVAALGAPLIACSLVIFRDLFILSFRAIAGERAVMPPSRLNGTLTGAPAKILTALILGCRVLAPERYVPLWWFWVAGAISGFSLLSDVWSSRRVIGRYFHTNHF